MYQPIEWFDETTQYPYRYTETVNGDGTIDHEPAHGATIVAGTPQSASNFQHMEGGIHDAGLASSIFLQAWRIIDREIQEELTAETGTATLTNSNTGHFLFNNSGQTIALDTPRMSTKYDVEIVVTSVTGGQLDDIEVYDKALNGFKVKFAGSASSVGISYKVKGGMKE